MASAELGLWWGTIEGAGLRELIDVASESGFAMISVTPAMYFSALANGETDASLRAALQRARVTVAMIDPLIRGLPGAPGPSEVARRFRSTFEHGEDDCWRAAEALDAPALNLAHYLCAPVTVDELVTAIGGLAARAAARNRNILVEFMPEGSIPDLTVATHIIALVGADNVGLMLDTWHYFRTSGDIAVLRSLPRGVIRAMQLSDAPRSFGGTGIHPPSSDRVLPGDGDIPLREIIAVAQANNPDVVIGAEVFDRNATDIPSGERATRAMKALQRVMS